MDKHAQEPKRILRSTLARPSETSGTTVKRLKISNQKVKELQGKKRRCVSSKMSGSKQSTVSASSGYTASIHKAESPALRSIKSKREYMISLPEDTSIGWISGFCCLPSGEIVFADFYNKKLKKLDRNYKVISTCDLPSVAVGMCYVGDNKVVVSLGEKLQFADVTGDMQLTISVDINTYCKGLTFHESYIYIVNERTVFIYSPKGKFIRELYTNNSKDAYFQDIAVSDDGQRIYISSWHMGLITIDSSGNHLHTFFDENLKAPFGICLDDRSNVLMCLTWLGIVVQFSSDGRQNVGQVIKTTDSVTSPSSLYFDKETSSLTVGGGSNKICILELF